ncbi:hypothetical protein BHE74_00014822, partial [Ensete ventricosum]
KNDPALEAYRSRVLYTNHEREPDNDPRGPIKEEVGDGGSNGGDEVFIAVDFSEVYQDRVFSERKGTEEAVRFDAEPEGIGCMACGNIRQDSVFGSAVMGHLYLHRRVGHTWATLSLPYLTSRQAPIVRGIVRLSTTISALTRRLSPAIRGQGVLGQGALVEGWSGTLALLHRSLSGETVSWPQDRREELKFSEHVVKTRKTIPTKRATSRGSSCWKRVVCGVRWRPWGRWATEIHDPCQQKRVWLGRFDTTEEAATVYDMAAMWLKGSKVVLNFPVARPTVRTTEEEEAKV